MFKKLRLRHTQDFDLRQNDSKQLSTCDFLDLPVELLFSILRHFTSQELSGILRLTCMKLKAVSDKILNQRFNRLDNRIQQEIHRLNELLPNLTSSPRYICVKRDDLEVIHFDYKIVKAVIWRHIYIDKPLCSFYAGGYIDSVEMVIGRPLDMHVPSELAIVLNFSKKFLDHFEQAYESKVARDWTIVGSKLLDILNCQEESSHRHQKIVNQLSVDQRNGVYKWKGVFTFGLSWYCQLGGSKTRGWEAVFMKMSRCFRRIVHRSGIYALNHFHCSRQIRLYGNCWTPMKSYYYSGFHKKSLTFYGCLNCSNAETRALTLFYNDIRLLLPEAYHQAIYIIPDQNPVEDVEADDEMDDNELENQQDGVQGERVLIHIPDLGVRNPSRRVYVNNIVNSSMCLKISFELECPFEVAPINIIQTLPQWNFKNRPRKDFKKLGFIQNIELDCNMSRSSFLPSTRKWFTKFKPVEKDSLQT